MLQGPGAEIRYCHVQNVEKCIEFQKNALRWVSDFDVSCCIEKRVVEFREPDSDDL